MDDLLHLKLKIVDAHIHLPMSEKEPYKKLIAELKANSINNFQLILNSKDEVDHYFKIAPNIEREKINCVPAILLDVHDDMNISFLKKLDKLNFKYNIKLHPRISNITTTDFELIKTILASLGWQTVIIDNWIFGPRLENHIGMQLSIFVAENFPNKNVVMAHAGGVNILENMLITRPVHNIYYDLALTCLYFGNSSITSDVIHFIKYTKNRIVFGSDFPEFSIKESRDALYNLCQKAILSKTEIENIFWDLPMRLFFYQ